MARAERRAVVLLSGGLNSTTTLAIAKSQGFVPHALTFRYGQPHQAEIEAAQSVAATQGVEQHVIVKLQNQRIASVLKPVGALGDLTPKRSLENPNIRRAQILNAGRVLFRNTDKNFRRHDLSPVQSYNGCFQSIPTKSGDNYGYAAIMIRFDTHHHQNRISEEATAKSSRNKLSTAPLNPECT